MKNTTKIQDPKIHAYLAQCGLGSRRQIEKWILEKRVLVNGKLCVIGQRVSSKDKILVDGKKVAALKERDELPVVIAYHKQVGEICTRAQSELPTVFEHLPEVNGRWISVGRLDVNTSGLLLFTNNGTLANRLMHPKYEVERKYHVRVYGKLNQAILNKFLTGIMLDGDFLKFDSIQPLKSLITEVANQWFIVTLRQGKYREIRRLFESQDCQVSRLMRVEYGNISLPRSLRQGQYQYLSQAQIEGLIGTR